MRPDLEAVDPSTIPRYVIIINPEARTIAMAPWGPLGLDRIMGSVGQIGRVRAGGDMLCP